jgi:hypothetical protein
MARTKKLTDSTYSPTIAASEEAIRTQIDDSIQEAHDLALEDVTTNRKLSPTGDFTGTINGGDVTLTEPGLSGAFNAHLAEKASEEALGHVKVLPANIDEDGFLIFASSSNVFVDVSSFGAVGDGIADDTTSFQNAINAIANGGTLYLSNNKTYKINGSLVIGNKNNIIIEGNGSTIKRGTAPIVESDNLLLALVLSNNICIKNLTLHGDNETLGKLEAVDHNLGIYGCKNVWLGNVKSMYSPCDGFYINRIGTGNTFQGVTAAADTQSEQITMINCIADYNARQGMSIISVTSLIATNCKFNNTGKSTAGNLAPSAGVDLEPNTTFPYVPHHVTFTNCEFVGNSGGHCIASDKVISIIFDNCKLEDGGSYGISSNAAYTSVRNCKFKNTGASARPNFQIVPTENIMPKGELINCEFESMIFGAMYYTECSYLDIKNCTIKDGANFGIRSFTSVLYPAKGKLTVDGLTIERLYESTPPSGSAYIMGNNSANVELKNILIDRDNATGTPIENGMILASYTNVQLAQNIDIKGTFATTLYSGWGNIKTARDNKINSVFSNELSKYGEAVYDAPSIAANAQATATITVAGAALGDFVEVAFSISLGGLKLHAYVSATNTVTCVFTNNTGSAIDLGSGTIKARVTKLN